MSQELFHGFEPPDKVPRDVHQVQYEVGGSLVRVPISVWKDGRMRADLSTWGAGVIVSASDERLADKIRSALAPHFSQALDAGVKEVMEAVKSRGRKLQSSQRLQNKLLRGSADTAAGERKYINPFREKWDWDFMRTPDWLMIQQRPSGLEKLVYTRLLFPKFPVKKNAAGRFIGFCDERIRESGVISGLNQQALAHAVGKKHPRSVANALASLHDEGLIELTPPPTKGNQGATKIVRFLYHHWMDETSEVTSDVSYNEPQKCLPIESEQTSDERRKLLPNNSEQTSDAASGLERREIKKRVESHGSGW